MRVWKNFSWERTAERLVEIYKELVIMKVALIAFSVRGAMGQYLEALVKPLSQQTKVHLFLPDHYVGDISRAILHRFLTGKTKTGALRRLLNPVLARRVWKELQAVKPDIIHLFNGEGYPWGLLFARWARKDGVPFVVTVHDPEPHSGNVFELLNACLRRVTLTCATRIHLHNDCFADSIVKQGVPPKKLYFIPHGSLAERFTRYFNGGTAREPVALFFGRLEAYKGLDVLVEAGLVLEGRLKVVIAGPGKLPGRLLKTIRCHSKVFELHNRYLSDEEVAWLFQRASVCVLPYRQVTQSSVPLIAAAFGVPVVASALGGFLEDVPRVNGLLVPPGDSRALAQGITKAMGLVPRYPKELEFEKLSRRFVKMYQDSLT
ncbi:MAG: glycosyltransferase family 4 protein [Bacillota bacterium]